MLCTGSKPLPPDASQPGIALSNAMQNWAAVAGRPVFVPILV